MSSKRDREWEAPPSGAASAAPAVDTDAKRPRISSPPSALSSDVFLTLQRPELAPGEAHPMAVLDAIRAKLQSTSDPHLQARLLLQFSSAAASPGAKTAAAIDFLFSFLQQNQTQTQPDGTQKDAGSSGAIVVGAIVRGLRQLLAVKAAVVEPMIQVDAMGEQLMQCMSVGEDFKLRRDMMRIVVDCLMLTKKYKQVETLLHTCVQDHDAGMQAICLRGYLRLHDAGRCFAAETSEASENQNTAADHFDRLTAFVLFAHSETVRVLAAQVLVALANLHPQHEIASSKFFPTATTMKTTLFLPEKVFYVLGMAGNDASRAVRVEVARCLRGFSRVLASEVVEHAVVKTQIDEAVVDVAPEVVEMNTRRMMSSGVLLSLLEDVDVDVAAEASRTIARLSELAMAPDAGIGRWGQRALERAITAHFDVLPRANVSGASQLCRVLVNSLGRLLVCRQTLDRKTDFSVSSADLGCLLRSVASCVTMIKSAVFEILLVLQCCDLSSAWAVQRLVDFLLETVGSAAAFKNPSGGEEEHLDCWDKRLVEAARALGKKCAKVLHADVDLSDRVQQEASSQRNSRHPLLKNVCQALLDYSERPNGSISETAVKTVPAPTGSTLFFLKTSPSETPRVTSHTSCSVSSQAASSMDALRVPPADGNIAVYLKAIHRLRTAFIADQLDASFQFADVLVRLRRHVHSFPDASAAPAPTAHKYVSMQAMLSTSPSVSSGHTSVGSQDQNEAQAFASLSLPVDLQKGCQEMVDIASDVYVRAFALSSSPRTELLQLILLGRVGLVLGLLQNTTDSLLIIEKIRWVSKEATRLRFLVSETQQHAGDVWLRTQLLSDVNSLNDLKRAFVAIIRKAWPTSLIKAAIARRTSDPATSSTDVVYRRLAMAHACIAEPTQTTSVKPEPREITANWPFEQRVRFALTNTRDVAQVYVKSVLPNGDVAYHHVPAQCIRTQGHRKHFAEHTITLTVSPFSDPTAFTVAVCLGHPMLPGSVKASTLGSGETSPMMFKEISASVRVSIFHRTTSALRHATARSSTA